jgi:hypothetical protein
MQNLIKVMQFFDSAIGGLARKLASKSIGSFAGSLCIEGGPA